MKRKLLFVLVSLLATSVMWAADGDKFTKTTPQGIEMVFQVISEAGKTCQAGYFNEGSYSSTFFTAVDRSTEGDVTIPSEIDGYSVIAISERAFSYCNKLSSIVIPSSVKTINSYAFSSCSISSITIPEGVETIKEGAFRSCRNLENVVLPNSVTTIENDAFYGCEKLATINITNSVTTIGTYLFAGCNNVAVSVNNCSRWRFQNHVFSSYNDDDTSISIIIQNGVTTIGGSCFYNNDAITSVSIPNSVTKIEGYNRIPSTNGAFQACPRLSSLSIPNSVTSIGGYAFYGCGFTSIEIPGSVTRLEDNTFAYCPNLENVTINEGVEMIFNAFRNCDNLLSISIPSSVQWLSTQMLSGCPKLSSISINNNATYDSRSNCNAVIETENNKLIIGCKGTTIPEGVTTIGTHAFEGAGLTSITIPSTVTTIEELAFSELDDVESINVVNGNTVFDSRENCNAIIKTATNTLVLGCKNTTFPESVNTIGTVAFYGCHSITSLEIPSSITNIDDFAFDGCTNLLDITIPSTIQHIGRDILRSTAWYYNQPEGMVYLGDWAYAYKGYDSEFTLRDGIVGIADGAFAYSYNITSICIPSGVKYIGSQSFFGCEYLSSVILPASVTSIGSEVFYGCPNLKYVTSLSENPVEIDESVFLTTLNTYTWEYSFTNATLCVPAGKKNKYETKTAWNQFSNIVELTTSVVTPNKNMMTYASNFILDFTTPITGLKAYVVSEVSDGKAILTEVTSAVPAGTGLILKATAGQTYEIPYFIGDVSPMTNMLVGVTENTAIGGNDLDYILSNGKFVKANAGTLSAGKAYLKLENALARGIVDIDESVTAIDNVLLMMSEGEAKVYNLNGQRISQPTKGLNIVNGKKVIRN